MYIVLQLMYEVNLLSSQISSQELKLDFRVGISSKDLESGLGYTVDTLTWEVHTISSYF